MGCELKRRGKDVRELIYRAPSFLGSLFSVADRQLFCLHAARFPHIAFSFNITQAARYLLQHPPFEPREVGFKCHFLMSESA